MIHIKVPSRSSRERQLRKAIVVRREAAKADPNNAYFILSGLWDRRIGL